MKKLLAMLLGVLMALPVSAEVGDEISFEYEGQTLKYTILDDAAKTVEVKAGTLIPNSNTGNTYTPGNEVEGVIVIPEKVENNDVEYTVTSVGEAAFYNCSGITSVSIPETVTSIGRRAFYGCSCLESVNLPQGITVLNVSTFFECVSLKSITIPDGVTTIGATAFSGCSSLESVTIPAGVTKIDAYAFIHCNSLATITALPEVAPTSIDAFGGLYDTAKLIVPADGVDSYIYSEGEWARFSHLSTSNGKEYNAFPVDDLNYRMVTDNSVMLIVGDYDSLTEVVIPSNLEIDGASYSVTSIMPSAFQQCSALTSVTIPATVTSIGGNAFFGCPQLTSVTISEGVTTIGDKAFYKCTGLKSLTIPESVTYIGEFAFSECSALISMTIPGSVTTINEGMFSACHALSSVTIPESVTSIGSNVFNDCLSLASLTIPGSVTSIGNSVFNGCNALTKIILEGETPPSMSTNTFSYNFYKKIAITVPDNSLGSYLSTAWSYFSNITTESGETASEPFTYNELKYRVTDENSVMLVGAADSNAIDVVIPDVVEKDEKSYQVTHVGFEAFMECEITSVVMPSSVNFIGEFAFCACNDLISVTIPTTVIAIGSYAFCACSSLTTLTIPGEVTTIGTGVFEDCTNLRLLDMSETLLADLSSSVTGVPENTLIYVKEGTAGTENRKNVVVGDKCESLEINYGATPDNQLLLSIPHPFTADNVTIAGSFTEGSCHTIYLPFEMEIAKYGKFYADGTYNAADQTVNFNQVVGYYTAPNVPYMFKPDQDFSDGITIESVEVAETQADEDEEGFNGVYTAKEFNEDEDAGQLYYEWNGEKFSRIAAGAKINPCHAYFKLPASEAGNAPETLEATFRNPVITGINDVTAEEENADEPTYNLNGQRVGSDYRGVVIKKGSKTINFAEK